MDTHFQGFPWFSEWLGTLFLGSTAIDLMAWHFYTLETSLNFELPPEVVMYVPFSHTVQVELPSEL